MAQINGDRLLFARQKRGMTQTELGQKAYVSKQVISNIERGVTKTVSDPVINLLSYSLLVTVDYLKGESPNMDRNKDGAIVPIYLLPDLDYDYEIKELLKKHSKNKNIEILLRDIIYYLSQLKEYDENEKESYLGIKLLEGVVNILKYDDSVDLRKLVTITNDFENEIKNKKA